MSNHVSSIAIYEFYGDPGLHQLAFPQNAVLKINPHQQPRNGWLRGVYNEKDGWFPIWAVDFQPPPPTLPPPPPPPPQVHGNRDRLSSVIDVPAEKELGAVRKPVHEVRESDAPHGFATESNDDDESNGFDISKGIMGGQIRRAESEPPQDLAKSSIAVSNEIQKKGSRRFLDRFRKPQVKPFYHKKVQEPEWTATPQIIYEGKVIQEYKEPKRGFLNFNQA